jgi:hypothetical protein
VIFLNVTVPRAWQEPNNAVLASTLAKYPNAILLDWHGASEANPALVYNDGIHLTSSGAAQYAGMVIGAIGPYKRVARLSPIMEPWNKTNHQIVSIPRGNPRED